MHLVPKLSITMVNHTVTEDFFIVDLADMEVILGIQWMEALDEYTQSFKRMDFTFVVDGKKVVLRGWQMKDQRKFPRIRWRQSCGTMTLRRLCNALSRQNL